MTKRIFAWILIILFIVLNINLVVGYYRGASAMIYIAVVAGFFLLKLKNKGDTHE